VRSEHIFTKRIATAALCTLMPQLAMCDEPATTARAPAALVFPADTDQHTPKGALRYFDQNAATGGLKVARAAYHAVTDKEKAAADLEAQTDVELSTLEKAVREKFGKAAADDVIHAIGYATAEDIEDATETIAGDKATVKWKDANMDPVLMVRVDGVWKVAVGESLKAWGADDWKTYEKATRAMAALAKATMTQMAEGKLATADAVKDAVMKGVVKMEQENQTQPAGQ
jgi:hypothetical protein